MEAYYQPTPALPAPTGAGFHRAGRGLEQDMSRRDRKNALTQSAEQAQQSTEQQTPDQSTEATLPANPAYDTPEQAVVRRSLHMAREANASNAPVDPSKPERATLVRPAKGENPERRRVFGYDNGAGGKVPLTGKVIVVNAGSLESAYPTLAEAVKTTPSATVAELKTAGVASQAFRRAFRSGLIRFSKD